MLATFPPTLIVTGTRAMDLSPAIFTNSQLLKAGVRSTLIVGEDAPVAGGHDAGNSADHTTMSPEEMDRIHMAVMQAYPA